MCIVAAPPPELPHYEICNHFAQVGFEALDCSDTWSCRSATVTAAEHVWTTLVVVDALNLVAFLPPDDNFRGLLFTETFFRVLGRTPRFKHFCRGFDFLWQMDAKSRILESGTSSQVLNSALRHKQTTKQARFCVCHD